MRLRRQELPTINVVDGMEDSGGMTPAMDNNGSNNKSFGQHQHCNAIVSFVMKQKTLIRFVMVISLIFVGGFTVKRFSAADPSPEPEHVKVDTTHSYNANKLSSRMYSLEHLGLDINIVEKPVPSMKKWQMILDAYNKDVDSSYKFDQIVPPTQGYLFGRNGEEAPPFHARSTRRGKNRGLFASRDMRKGEVVHDGTDSDVTFPDAVAYRRFVFALPRKAACDITEWTWTQRLEQDGPMKIMLAINISAMLKTGLTSEEANVLPESSTSQ
eukprot:scaffold4950_cov121-Skeletonema_dohrnii-CCMP3373.AAC.1